MKDNESTGKGITGSNIVKIDVQPGPSLRVKSSPGDKAVPHGKVSGNNVDPGAIKPTVTTPHPLLTKTSQTLTKRIEDTQELSDPTKSWGGYLEDMRVYIGNATAQIEGKEFKKSEATSQSVLETYEKFVKLYGQKCPGQAFPAEVHCLKGQAEYILGDGECINSFEKALELDPNHKKTLYAYSMTLLLAPNKTSEDVNHAYELMTRVRELDITDVKVGKAVQTIETLMSAETD